MLVHVYCLFCCLTTSVCVYCLFRCLFKYICVSLLFVQLFFFKTSVSGFFVLLHLYVSIVCSVVCLITSVRVYCLFRYLFDTVQSLSVVEVTSSSWNIASFSLETPSLSRRRTSGSSIVSGAQRRRRRRRTKMASLLKEMLLNVTPEEGWIVSNLNLIEVT